MIFNSNTNFYLELIISFCISINFFDEDNTEKKFKKSATH